jgi:ribonuclease T1
MSRTPSLRSTQISLALARRLMAAASLTFLCHAAPIAARENNANVAANIETIQASRLPKQGQEVLQAIRAGGPFKHANKDGSTFGNVEKKLPKQPRGYYKEYTVTTPGASNRGARRIVCGGDVRVPAQSSCYYTDDHYNSFKRILE